MVVAIATLITFVGLATYAYFSGAINLGASNLNARTERNNLVFDTNGGAMVLNVSAISMQRAKTGNVAAQNSTTLTVNLTANTDYSMVCTYDIVYEWTSSDRYTAHSAGVSSKEFTIKASLAHNSHNYEGNNNIATETDLSNLSYTNGSTTVVSSAQIDATGSTMSTAVWTLESKIYNADGNQADIANKNFTGKFRVTNVSCVGGNITGAVLAINDVCTSGTNLNTCIQNLYTSDGENSLYYHSVGKTLSAEDGSYRFAGGKNYDDIYPGFVYIPAEYNNGVDSDSLITFDDFQNYSDGHFYNPIFFGKLINKQLIIPVAIQIEDNNDYESNNVYNVTSDSEMQNAFGELLQRGYIESKDAYYVPAEYNGGTDSKPYDLENDIELNDASILLASDGLITIDGYNVSVLNGSTYDITDSTEMQSLLGELISKGYISSKTVYYVPANYNDGADSKIYDIDNQLELLELTGLLTQKRLIIIDSASAGGYYSEGEESIVQNLLNHGYITPLTDTEPNNYVCFGSNSCNGKDNDNLYRIIGVIPVKLSSGVSQNLVKLVKVNSDDSNALGVSGDAVELGDGYYEYYWNRKNAEQTNNETGAYNIWSYSALNKENLNGYFLNTYLSSQWANKIANVVWKVAGNTWNAISGMDTTTRKYYGTAKTVYENEILHPNVGNYGNGELEYTAKVGLPYISDYVYSYLSWEVKPAYSSTYYSSYNWFARNCGDGMFITRNSADSESFFQIYNHDYNLTYLSVYDDYNDFSEDLASVYPSFYLNNNVTYVSGDGTIDNPIIVD